MKIKTIIYNNNNGEEFVYKEATYTNLDGMYGYLCVDINIVKFFWTQNNTVQVDIIDYMVVKHELIN
jgi:hypothetical protein